MPILGVEKVALRFGTENQQDLDTMTLQETAQYIEVGHFAVGSMLPKIEAARQFVQNGGPQAIITNPVNLTRALQGITGTRILPG
ncbi:MAG: hypothetical protein AAFQ07_05305 [Chloroflexota bacterium]